MATSHPVRWAGFTLIELLTVITIIAVLLGLLFPVITPSDNANLLYVLRAKDAGANADHALNRKQTRYLQPTYAKDAGGKQIGGVGSSDGVVYDPWGNPFRFWLDSDYDGVIPNPYTANAGPDELESTFIGISLGRDGRGGSGDAKVHAARDDVRTW